MSFNQSDNIFTLNGGFLKLVDNLTYLGSSFSSIENEIIEIGQSSHKMYSNDILNFQESTTILNAKIFAFILFYSISPVVCWFIQNPVFTYILNMIC